MRAGITGGAFGVPGENDNVRRVRSSVLKGIGSRMTWTGIWIA